MERFLTQCIVLTNVNTGGPSTNDVTIEKCLLCCVHAYRDYEDETVYILG